MAVVNYIHVVLVMVVLFVPRGDSLSCYECTSEKSMDDCNTKMTKTSCPSGSAQCLEGILSCFEGDVTKKVYVKRCSSPNSDSCETTRDDAPSCPTTSMSWSYSFSASCCSGDNCNSGMSPSPPPGSGASHSINRVMLGICMALIVWALAFTH